MSSCHCITRERAARGQFGARQPLCVARRGSAKPDGLAQVLDGIALAHVAAAAIVSVVAALTENKSGGNQSMQSGEQSDGGNMNMEYRGTAADYTLSSKKG